LKLPDAARRQIDVALRMIDAVDRQLGPLDRELRALARRQPGCGALVAHYGIGEITAVAILAELGDARRFSSSRHAVHYAGMDITVSESDRKRGVAMYITSEGLAPPGALAALQAERLLACRMRFGRIGSRPARRGRSRPRSERESRLSDSNRAGSTARR
jgi:transposase